MRHEPEENEPDQQELIDNFAAKQRNTLWPDALRNSSTVDELLWKGSPRPSKVQRAGVVVFGVLFMILAFSMATIAVDSHSPLTGLVACGLLYAASRMLWNSIPKRPKEP